jgi:hypothetical protein
MATLAERFAQSGGAPQEVDGSTVHSVYRRRVANGETVRIRRTRATATPVQGLRIKLERGTIVVNSQKLRDVVLWADSSPTAVEIQCETGPSQSSELRIWNCWKLADGIMHAWIGDAGMLVEEGRGDVSIRCSDGTHPFNPTDLDVCLTFHSGRAERNG